MPNMMRMQSVILVLDWDVPHALLAGRFSKSAGCSCFHPSQKSQAVNMMKTGLMKSNADPCHETDLVFPLICRLRLETKRGGNFFI